MAAQANSSTRSRHLAIKGYQNCSLNLLFHRLVASYAFAHELMREKMWWWLALARKKMWRWIASFGESYLGDVLQYPKQLFSLRLPQMTKYCVMRECDNIHSWISTIGEVASSHQQEFTVLNSQKGFWRSLPEISLFSLFFLFY
jgi:hypothetical protein